MKFKGFKASWDAVMSAGGNAGDIRLLASRASGEHISGFIAWAKNLLDQACRVSHPL